MTRRAAAAREEHAPGDCQELLKDGLQQTLGEARMALPGAQALFGLQLMAVFSDGSVRLSDLERELHLGALVLVTIQIA
ncbi:MAG: hypothetical protein JO090_00635 [Rhizobacter sp.]|nr:hypothetical protein [Rhizobacter sp.]